MTLHNFTPGTPVIQHPPHAEPRSGVFRGYSGELNAIVEFDGVRRVVPHNQLEPLADLKDVPLWEGEDGA